jgi:hypothetical protein
VNPWLELELGALSWAPSAAALAALGILLPVIAVSMARAWRRLSFASPLLRYGVITLNVLALVAVAALLAPPRFGGLAAEPIILFTDGMVESEDAQSGLAYSLGTLETLASSSVQVVRTPGQIILREPALDALQVFGHGLNAQQWDEMPPWVTVKWEPPTASLIGPVAVHWPAMLDAGETLLVNGRLLLAEDDAIAELRLLDPAGDTVTSTSVATDETFVLAATPRAPGALVYRLQLRLGERVLSDEPVAVYVRKEPGAQLLVLQSAPSFETRQLANWAADRGSRLLIQSRISRDRDLIQGVNLPDAQSLELSADFFAETDLAVLDGRRWANLGEAERERLLQAVRSGLGLLLLADEELAAWLDRPARWNLLGLRLSAVPSGEPRWPRWRGAAPTQPLPVVPWRIDTVGAQTLTADEAGQSLESWKGLGRGRIAVSLLRERHRWATSGDQSAFARYWGRLLREVGRPTAGQWFAPSPAQRVWPGQRTRLCAQGDGKLAMQFFALAENRVGADASTQMNSEAGFGRVESAASTGLRAASRLQPHSSGAPLQCGYAWPATPGWHQLNLLTQDGALVDGIMLNVQDEDAWSTDRAARRQAATRARMTMSQSADLAVSPDSATARRRPAQPLSPGWAWGLLLLTLGSLWLERRLQDLR